LTVTFNATATAVEGIGFFWRARCADGYTHTNAIYLGDVSLRSGRFTTSDTLNTGASASISGQVTGRSASGLLPRTGPSAFGTDCTATGITWHAHLS
jgi:hypothetical protein